MQRSVMTSCPDSLPYHTTLDLPIGWCYRMCTVTPMENSRILVLYSSFFIIFPSDRQLILLNAFKLFSYPFIIIIIFIIISLLSLKFNASSRGLHHLFPLYLLYHLTISFLILPTKYCFAKEKTIFWVWVFFKCHFFSIGKLLII